MGGSVGNREGAARAVWKVLRGEASWPRRAGGASLGRELRAASCARPLVTSPRVSPPAVCSPSERCPPWSSPRPDSRWSGSATRFSASAGGGGGVLLQTLCPWRRDTWLLAARCLLGSSGLRDVAAPSFPQTGPPCPVSLHTPVWQSPSPPGSVSPVSRV